MKEFVLMLYFGIFLTAILMACRFSYNEGRQYENKRIEECYENKDFSGFAWVDGSKYFTCASEIKAGKVYYKH